MESKISPSLGIIFILIPIITGIIYFMPWSEVNWGNFNLMPGSVVTVTGEAESKEKNQIANYSAGVNATKDDKQEAINEVNQKIETIISKVKQFGVPAEDIQTSNLSIYQNQDSYYEGDKQRTRPGQWSVRNTITVKLKDVEKASDLTIILSDNGATDIYGPNFQMDDTKDIQKSLLKDAIEDARDKAAEIAKASNKKLGDIISVSEGTGSNAGVFRYEGFGAGGGGGAYEPGTGTVQTTVTVTFKLK